MASNQSVFRHILITGASSGIGAALARFYAAPDVCLFLTGRSLERLFAMEKDCVDKGATVFKKIIDVTDRVLMRAWIEELDSKHPIDLVIANAGISGGTGSAQQESIEQLDELFTVNVGGVFNTIDPVIMLMKERGFGQIGLMSSLASFRGFPGAPGYCASKAAVRIYGEGLRGSLEGSGIGVSVICPGFVRTPMTDVNDYKMPFLMSADTAARIIGRGLACNKGRIAFPVPTYFLSWLLSVLPDFMVHRLLKNVPSKPSLE